MKASGFNGQIRMMVYGSDNLTHRILKEKGIQVYKFDLDNHVVIDRFRDLPSVVSDLSPETWVLFPDVGDIVFQYNPAHFLLGVHEDIVCANEGVRFSQNDWTNKNLLDSFPGYYDWLKYEFFYNAGSIAARAGILSRLSKEIYDLCKTVPNGKNHDQAAFNILVRQPRYCDRTLFLSPNDAWCFCGASSVFLKPGVQSNYEADPVIIKDGICFAQPNLLTCMFHHYNRNISVMRTVTRRVDLDYNRRR